ncbi:hypothetical protein SHKM778_31520 [Streptomyces sp. KM77-8]|uniref:SDR family NAD(P)-dependent oxidoreductase n=1 Tax=Streptomyces haneummycinicus TaxID=3074435 RepID=A0AAT9HH75_9ACTN
MTNVEKKTTLSGKVALVTGGSRGIGAATALRLAREGADVAVTYVNGKDAAGEVVRAVQATGRRAVALRADAGDAEEAAGAVDAAVRALGRLDVLVNNAGVGVLGPLESLSPADVDRVLAVNVRGCSSRRGRRPRGCPTGAGSSRSVRA